MKCLVDDLFVTCDEIENTPKNAQINPSDGINYWFVAFLIVNHMFTIAGGHRYEVLHGTWVNNSMLIIVLV